MLSKFCRPWWRTCKLYPATIPRHNALLVESVSVFCFVISMPQHKKARNSALNHFLAHSPEWGSQRQRWDADELVTHFQACLHTRNAEGLANICTILSRSAVKHGEVLAGSARSPGQTTLKRLYLRMDLALILFERQRNPKPLAQCRYLWLDSSPQGNRDWLLGKAIIIQGRDLLTAQRAADWLAAAAASEEAKTDCHMRAESQRQRNILRRCLRHHTLTPAAIGLAEGNVAHKSAAVLHSLMLETDPGLLADTLASVASMTTDLGVEVGIAGFKAQPQELVPPWRQQWTQQLFTDAAHPSLGSNSNSEPLQADCFTAPASQEPSATAAAAAEELPPLLPDPDSHCACVGSSPACVPRLSPDVSPKQPRPSLPACHSFSDRNGYADPLVSDPCSFSSSSPACVSSCLPQSPPSLPPPPEPPSSECGTVPSSVGANLSSSAAIHVPGENSEAMMDGPDILPMATPTPTTSLNSDSQVRRFGLMPNAILVPGMLHICNNLLCDADNALTHWDPFWRKLNNLASLLSCPQRLSRFSATCLAADAPIEVKALFQTKVERPYTKRLMDACFRKTPSHTFLFQKATSMAHSQRTHLKSARARGVFVL